jgi:pyrimidine 5'-nucleotidase
MTIIRFRYGKFENPPTLSLSLEENRYGTHRKASRANHLPGFMMRIVFDLDNTLYSFGKTGIADKMHENIVNYMVERLGLKPDEALKMSSDYYHKYGLTIAGLIQFHGVDPVDYCNYVHRIDAETRLTINPELVGILQKLVEEGNDLWILTNADYNHAVKLLTILGCIDVFRSPVTGQLKIIDCFAQWKYSQPQFLNKPFKSAYEHCLEVFAKAEEDGTAACKGCHCIMVDDSVKNLEAPHELGWSTVWIQHDVPTQPPSPHPPHYSIYDIHHFPGVYDDLKARFGRKN